MLDIVQSVISMNTNIILLLVENISGVIGNSPMGVVSERKASICGAVLANDLVIGGSGAYEKEWDINGEKAVLSVTKA